MTRGHINKVRNHCESAGIENATCVEVYFSNSLVLQRASSLVRSCICHLAFDHDHHYQIFAGASLLNFRKFVIFQKIIPRKNVASVSRSQSPQPGNEVVLVPFLSRKRRNDQNMGKTRSVEQNTVGIEKLVMNTLMS